MSLLAKANAKTGLLDLAFVGLLAGAIGGLVAYAWAGSYVSLFAAALTGQFMTGFVEFARKEQQKIEVEPLSSESLVFHLIIFIFFPGTTLGILLQSQLVRLMATLRKFGDGISAMPRNITNLCLNTSPGQFPELLPGLPSGHAFRLENIYTEIKRSIFSPGLHGKEDFFLLPFIFVFWFVPGWTYRFIIKSTMWFWWVLYVIGGSPEICGGLDGLRADVKTKWNGRLQLLFSIVCVLFFIIPWFKPFALNQELSAPLLPWVALVFLVFFDLSTTPLLPIVGLMTAVLSIWLWVWTDSLHADSGVEGRDVSTGLRQIGLLIKVKRALGLISIGLLMLYIFLVANAAHSWIPVSPFGIAWLEFLYGNYATALVPKLAAL